MSGLNTCESMFLSLVFTTDLFSYFLFYIQSVFRPVGHQLHLQKVQERQGRRQSAGRGRQVSLPFSGKQDCLTGE